MLSPRHSNRLTAPSRWTKSAVLGAATALALTCGALAQKGPSGNPIDPDAISFAEGLQPMIERLSAQDDLTQAQTFTLAGAQFLRGVELAYQTRYRYGASEGMAAGLALMRLGLRPNPEPEPFTGAVIETLFSDVDSQMDEARATLATLGQAPNFTAPVDLTSLWLDINTDGEQQPMESLPALLFGMLGGRGGQAGTDAINEGIVADFDGSDAAWLAAYTHFLSSTANLVLALQPAPIIDDVFADGAALDERFSGRPNRTLGGETRGIDTIVSWILVLEQTPLAEHTREAREHMIAMVAKNRVFWEAVAAETDQGREWIPSPTQTAALPITFPGEVGPRWLAVLDDVEAMLEGRLLVPHWRLGGEGATHGINIKTFLDTPQSTDLLGLFHGRGVLFAVEEGPIISADNWQAFQTLVGRGGGFFPFLLN